MSALRLIRRTRPMTAQDKAYRAGYCQPINPLDTTLRYRAQSVLIGIVKDPLPDTVEQARDVIAWAERIPQH